MMEEIRTALAVCLERFRAGTLAEADLRAALAIAERPKKQSLLYLQCSSSNPRSRVIGISIFEDGKDADGLDEKGAFRYRTLGEAVNDGWRIVKFPEMSLGVDDQENHGLGCEYILERWRQA
jgi:hypothetical protein